MGNRTLPVGPRTIYTNPVVLRASGRRKAPRSPGVGPEPSEVVSHTIVSLRQSGAQRPAPPRPGRGLAPS